MPRAPIPLVLAITVSSCVAEPPPGNPTRETLPNGAVLVRYPDLPAIDSVGPEVTEAQVDLRFGSRDGTDRNLTSSDIRGIQAAGNGDIYVLDQRIARGLKSRQEITLSLNGTARSAILAVDSHLIPSYRSRGNTVSNGGSLAPVRTARSDPCVKPERGGS